MQAKRKKLLIFLLIPVSLLMVLFAVYCILYPFFGTAELLGNTIALFPSPYYATYGVGLLLVYYLVFLLNGDKHTNPNKKHLEIPFRALFLAITGGFLICLMWALLLARFESWQGFYVITTQFGQIKRRMSLFGALLFSPPFFQVFRVSPHLRKKMPIAYDYCIIAVYSVMGFVKLGCHAAGCCYGIHIDHILFNRDLFPVQLLEALTIFITLGFLMWYQIKAKFYIPGTAYPLGLLLYCPARFIWEYYRYHWAFDRNYIFNGLMTFWQFLSVIGFAAGAIWLGIVLWQNKKESRR